VSLDVRTATLTYAILFHNKQGIGSFFARYFKTMLLKKVMKQTGGIAEFLKFGHYSQLTGTNLDEMRKSTANI